MAFVLQWIDLIWLPVALVIVHKPQRFIALGMLAACMVMMRMQIELMESTGYAHGMLPLLKMHAWYRGMAVYSLFYAGYLALAFYSRGGERVIFMAASISIFFAAMISSTLVMLL
ncbi:MAG: hypothetical protein ACPGRX_06195 [Bdellovibrionales bacterium]